MSRCADNLVLFLVHKGLKEEDSSPELVSSFTLEYIKGNVQDNQKVLELKGVYQVLIDADNLLGKDVTLAYK